MDIFQYRENKKVSILLVEDEEILSKIYFNALAKEGYKVFVSKNGKSAINKYNEHHIAVIILDLMLPDVSGLDVLHHIRKVTAGAKVIVLTNMINSEVKRECVELGVDMYLSKSDYTPDQIVTCIRSLVSSARSNAIR